MILKLVILLIICVPLLLFDMVNIKNEKPRAKFIYAFLVLVSIYLSSIFVFELRWPILFDAADFLLGTPARLIVEFLHVTPQ
ncbi:hypothetical protein [Paenibacillus sp. Soil750]|uniref:hypothetical protein n=1 Tax=Paenibacillus sp. Soil750 TaxID=1736398 RepID=UPI00070010D9|nr:hypothetical protein [Paenibacillus sp. Soil750]KRE70012.1 hypothetical protein ASL11_16800 [Paenibacillus sp. Soil750]